MKKNSFSLIVIIFLAAIIVGLTLITICFFPQNTISKIEENKKNESLKSAKNEIIQSVIMWEAPKTDTISDKKEQELIVYGKDLIANTSKYLGPNGIVGKLSNGMNCQNCHMDAGTKPLGNNYSAVYASYPKFRARSGTKETIVKRISDCFERSLNGTKPDSNSKEMKAMFAYMKFLGSNVQKGKEPNGSGLEKIAYLNRAADPIKGKLVYDSKCAACHGNSGLGIKSDDKKSFTYPPLWGKESYNDAAGLYRLSNFAGYVKNNMPFGASYQNKILTDEESWDVAAFVNTQPRPHKDQNNDWQDISKKPIDFPYGPYTDKFTEVQHKLGPFQPIKDFRKN